MSSRAERAAGELASGLMNGRRFAEHIGVAHGTIKRWLHEGMPAQRNVPGHYGVWIDPVAAQAWIDQRFPRKTIAFARRSFVYIAQREDGAIKIGWTSDVVRRIYELRKESGAAVELVGCMPGRKAQELALHQAFADRRLDGEWFRASAEEVFAVLLTASKMEAA